MHIINPQLTKLKVVFVSKGVCLFSNNRQKGYVDDPKRDISININNSILVGLRLKLAMIKDKM
ncbi:hypothetical protein DUG19_25365 [Salmonella enterica subsp. enterica serovar 4,[5],12:i:-]|nr:hypothetical protein [Salmonella enterica subsp. enterica serovar 4,[5],12:i:-]